MGAHLLFLKRRLGPSINCLPGISGIPQKYLKVRNPAKIYSNSVPGPSEKALKCIEMTPVEPQMSPFANFTPCEELVLFCQPRVEVTSCFGYKFMGLTFHDMINTQLIYRFELAQVVSRRITKPQQFFLGSNLTGCSFYYSVFIVFFRGGWSLILLFSSCLIFFFLFNF